VFHAIHILISQLICECIIFTNYSIITITIGIPTLWTKCSYVLIARMLKIINRAVEIWRKSTLQNVEFHLSYSGQEINHFDKIQTILKIAAPNIINCASLLPYHDNFLLHRNLIKNKQIYKLKEKSLSIN